MASFRPWRVVLFRALHWEKPKTEMVKQERKIVDRIVLRVKGGHGGPGCNAFRKSMINRHGRVDGGNGGIGGKVILRASAEIYDFKNIHYFAAGKDGSSGASRKQTGKRGLDEVVHVPLGTVVHLSEGTIPDEHDIPPRKKVANPSVKVQWEDPDWMKLSRIFSKDVYSRREASSESEEESEPETAGENENENEAEGNSEDEEDEDEDEEDENDEALPIKRPIIRSNMAELLEPGETFVVALGGAGGRGNAALPRALPKKNKWPGSGLPRMENEPGDPGTEAVIVLELKSIADVGLVGFPNAGKSTLLGAISKAKPRVGNYPFTTLRPIIGRVEYEDFYSLDVADVPGLIEGAHENRGLGFNFLRHVERTKAFVYVLDASLGVGDRSGPYAWDQLEKLMHELECYRNGLTKRRAIVAANKIDEEGSEEVVKELKKRTPLPVYPICAVLGEGLEELKNGIRLMVDSEDSTVPDLQELRI